MSDEGSEVLGMLASLRRAGKTTPEQWGELASLITDDHCDALRYSTEWARRQPSLFPKEAP